MLDELMAGSACAVTAVLAVLSVFSWWRKRSARALFMAMAMASLAALASLSGIAFMLDLGEPEPAPPWVLALVTLSALLVYLAIALPRQQPDGDLSASASGGKRAGGGVEE